MEFFDRDREIGLLRDTAAAAQRAAQFTVITGRRRIGKTSLVLHALGHGPQLLLYFFVGRKSEAELCRDFTDEMTRALGQPMLAAPVRFSAIFDYLIQLSHTRPITVFLDEFQEFMRVNKSVYWDMQRLWDLNKDGAKINLVVCGSVNSMMNRLFRDHKQPLYGRQTMHLTVKAFPPQVIKEILAHYNPHFEAEDLLALYALTGGVAKYVQQFIDHGMVTQQAMLNYTLAPDSYFLDEGKTMLIEEFGKDDATYFSILSLIAQGHSTRADIENILKREVGGYLTRLEAEYGLVLKASPLLPKSVNRNVRYRLADNYLIFWFRFIYKYDYMVEAGAIGKLKQLVVRDWPTWSGRLLERYFVASMVQRGTYTRLGSWWDRKGENEIDIIGIDELARKIDFYEVKRQQKELDLPLLEQKARVFLTAHPQLAAYKMRCQGLTMADM